MTDGVQTNEVDGPPRLEDRAANGDGPGVVTDVVLPGSRRRTLLGFVLGLVAVAVIVPGVVAVIQQGMRIVPTCLCFGLGSIVWLLVILSVVMHLYQKRAERIYTQFADSDERTLVSHLIRIVYPGVLTETLVKHERWGLTARLARERDFTPLEPIDVPFEPQLLGLADGPTELGRTGPDHADASRKMRTRIYTGTIAAVILVFAIWLSWATGRWWSIAVPAALGWGTNLLFALNIISFGGLTQSLAVPGGMVVRESGFLRQSWRLHVYDRRSSVLTAARKADEQWFLCVADATKQLTFTLNRADVDFLLRAWLSPLHPPGVEQLSDLR